MWANARGQRAAIRAMRDALLGHAWVNGWTKAASAKLLASLRAIAPATKGP